MPNGWIMLCTPPASIASARPSRISSAASPIAWALAEHAVRHDRFGPRAPKAAARCPEGVPGSCSDSSSGSSSSAPCDVNRRVSSRPPSSERCTRSTNRGKSAWPSPEPRYTPNRDGSTPRPSSSPESRTACAATASAIRVFRPCPSQRVAPSPRSLARSNPLISAAIRVANDPASNSVTGPTPPRPSRSDSQVDSTSCPTGVTSPIPVTTTRLPARCIEASPSSRPFNSESTCRTPTGAAAGPGRGPSPG